ncbi:RNA-directed DNA polymerase [Myxococcus qinghaiensis]|uniref:RNA-directed DNA polymerase n=1 Tax=Myxococcus qinghaiensis TaxID=2906758 RepID=UPI0020A7C653|nr:RNA-directed DNA polymerase [Myxococcus qinghaiensis]MCP3166618.1 RNA-directed DNA polymerase [Myxococcus qinghaiensis]
MASELPILQDHLLWSYRLAKFEVAAERRGTGRLNFAQFEQNLAANLKAIGERGVTSDRIFRSAKIGRVWIRPKSIGRRDTPKSNSSFISIPEQPIEHRIERLNVRVLLEPSPEFAISEVLWLRAYGPALDALLTPSCLANRLNVRGTPARIPAAGRRIYKYWVPAYRSFREAALDEARLLLGHESGRCTLAALDLTSYFDCIDPRFLIEESFIHKIERAASWAGIPFNSVEYIDSTQGLLDAFGSYRALVGDSIGVEPTIGVPVGSLTARLIANLALCDFDDIIAARPGITYYGRYVDDILIVQRREKTPALPPREFISSLLPLSQKQGSVGRYVLDGQAIGRTGSSFEIQASKLRVFNLEGPQGLEYLGAVAGELDLVSSERRRFLDPRSEHLQHLVSASPGAEPIRALREADALNLRKLAVSSVCEKVMTAAAMLSREDASKFSRSHLGRVGRIATDWSRWVDLLDQSNKILAAALVAGDVKTANEVFDSLWSRVTGLAGDHGRSIRVQWGPNRIAASRARRRLQEWVAELLVETICSSAVFDERGFSSRGVRVLDDGFSFRKNVFLPETLLRYAQLLSSSDLRWVDRETDFYMGCALVVRPLDALAALEHEAIDPQFDSDRVMRISEFRKACEKTRDPIFSSLSEIELLLLARPPSYSDIMLRWLRAERPLVDLVHVVNAVRGTSYLASAMEEIEGGAAVVAMSPQGHSTDGLREAQLVLGNLCTEEKWWEPSLTAPVLSMERQRRLSRVLNQAIEAAGRAKQRGIATMLVLPELSLPRRWLREVMRHIGNNEPTLSLIAGVEYEVVGDKVYNEAVAFVPRAYMSAAGWIWTKRRPAHHEARLLRKERFEFATRATDRRFTVFHSEHGRFIPLICSELLEVDARSKLLGRIDLLLVPAWNKDITSFEYLVHSTALELHSFVGVANNGIFSDCRVRGPYSDPWKREASRLITRGQNETVVVELQIGLLQKYRADPELYERERTTIHKDDWPEWKPVPPGMVSSDPVPSRAPSKTGGDEADPQPLEIKPKRQSPSGDGG